MLSGWNASARHSEVIHNTDSRPEDRKESRIEKQTRIDTETETQVESGWIIQHRGVRSMRNDRSQEHKFIEHFFPHHHAH